MTTAGERSGRDYGHDPYAYYSRYDDAGHAAWDTEPRGYRGAEYPTSGYRPVDYPADPFPPRRDAYPTSGYPGGDYPRGGYPRDGAWVDEREPARPRPQPTAINGRSRPDGPGAGRGEGRKKRRGMPLWQEVPLLLVIAFCLAVLVRTFLMQAFFIPSGSMEDTLVAGDRVLVNKVVYNFREPARGEVVVFRGTDAWAPEFSEDDNIGTLAKVGRTFGDLIGISQPGEKDFIKRVIGVPGDTVSCCDVDGRVFVNGQPIDESSYVIRDSPLDGAQSEGGDCRSRRFDEVVVQPGQLFVMGDHRQVSQDSRCQGQVPIDNVIGRAFLIVWPSGRWDNLSTPDTFAAVPSPVAAGAPAPLDGPPPGSAPAQLAVVLPLLLPLGTSAMLANRSKGTSAMLASRSKGTFRGNPARSRLPGRGKGRRLAG